ncbi:MAG: amino acid ABC transporter permease [Anderseniella sp.]|jgi:general L-amino acid transport system permease protein|nr:amino acid ABC transporter permease [Anderseniella sp.]
MSDLHAETSVAFVRTQEVPASPPPANITGLQGWMRENLFPTPIQSVLTVVMGGIAAYIAWLVLDWAVIHAVFVGENGEACRGEGRQEGACWAMAGARFGQWIYGFYPVAERWRVNIVFIVGILALVPMLIPSLPFKTVNAVFLLTIYPIMALILLTGGHFDITGSTWFTTYLFVAAAVLPILFLGFIAKIIDSKLALIASLAIAGVAALLLTILSVDFGLTYVETSQWGGLLVTLVIAVTGIVASLPLGILLALGRRSNMPVVKLFSVAFIELWRGVPLITVLFMASVMLPLFLPPGTNFDKLLRALVGVALFSSAYMAEVVRGGLQAIPKGQTEAAQALGLTFWQNMGLITLPQALKLVIPGIVNTFIGLFKDTTLVSIIGLYDLLLIIQTANTDANWAAPQTHSTGLFAAAALFWIFCFGMSRYSMFMERKLDTGHKR